MESKEAVKRLENEFNENINSHVFLLETNNIDKCLNDVKRLSRKIIKTKDEITYKQIDDETYLELIVIRPDGKEIKKNQILNLQERLKTNPVLSDNFIYIIIPAEALSEISANKLLKTIEEPNEHAIGFLITSNSDLLLPTIKSRCETLNLIYEECAEEIIIDENCINLATSLVDAIERKNHIEFTKIKANNNILKENANIIENLIKDYYNTACNLSKNGNLNAKQVEQIQLGNTYNVLVRKAKYLNTILNKHTKNMNTDLFLEKIFFDLKDVK